MSRVHPTPLIARPHPVQPARRECEHVNPILVPWQAPPRTRARRTPGAPQVSAVTGPYHAMSSLLAQAGFLTQHADAPRHSLQLVGIVSLSPDALPLAGYDVAAHANGAESGGSAGEALRCRNYGCSQTFAEDDNHEAACSYHTGPPVFHDTKKGWSCCPRRVYDWDEFHTVREGLCGLVTRYR
jgi:hypothetical protein